MNVQTASLDVRWMGEIGRFTIGAGTPTTETM